MYPSGLGRRRDHGVRQQVQAAVERGRGHRRQLAGQRPVHPARRRRTPARARCCPTARRSPCKRTASPAELDDIYSALNKLSVALGPNGANKNGALNDLVNVSAREPARATAPPSATASPSSSAAARTLANGRGDLFATVAQPADVHQAPWPTATRRCAISTRMLAAVAGRPRRRARRPRRGAAQPRYRARPGRPVRPHQRRPDAHRPRRAEDAHQRAGQGEGLAQRDARGRARSRWPTSCTPISPRSAAWARAATWPR